MNLFPNTKKTHRHRKQTQDYQRGEEVGRERNYEFGISIHTAIYQLDNQEGSTVQHRELYTVPCNNL